MKRDMDLLRKIVLFMEDQESGFLRTRLQFDGYTDEQIGYHAYLLVDANLATGNDATVMSSTSPYYLLLNLTFAGHEFAENARNPHIWDEVQENMREKGIVSASLDVVKKLLDKAIKKRLELD